MRFGAWDVKNLYGAGLLLAEVAPNEQASYIFLWKGE
jgi:hypothetical protein